jgi:membrane fusion protein, multidrug efflux system
MKSIYLLSLAIVMSLAACGGKKNSLESKKAELDKLKQEIASLQSKAKLLEDEISKAEPKNQ